MTVTARLKRVLHGLGVLAIAASPGCYGLLVLAVGVR